MQLVRLSFIIGVATAAGLTGCGSSATSARTAARPATANGLAGYATQYVSDVRPVVAEEHRIATEPLTPTQAQLDVVSTDLRTMARHLRQQPWSTRSLRAIRVEASDELGAAAALTHTGWGITNELSASIPALSRGAADSDAVRRDLGLPVPRQRLAGFW